MTRIVPEGAMEVVVFSEGQEEAKEATLTNGMNDYLSKPIDIDALIDVPGQFLR